MIINRSEVDQQIVFVYTPIIQFFRKNTSSSNDKITNYGTIFTPEDNKNIIYLQQYDPAASANIII